MLIGIAGKKRSGKDTVAKIFKLLNKLKIHTIKYDTYKLIIDQYRNSNDSDNVLTGIISIIKNKDLSIYSPIYHFAEPVKQIAAILCNVTIDFINSDNCKNENIPDYVKCPLGRTYRHLFQYIGTEVGRNILGNNIWIDILNDKLQNDSEELAIVSDIRFKNEADYIKDADGIVIEIRSDRSDNSDDHSSESISDIDANFVIDNNGSIDDLVCDVFNLYYALRHHLNNN